MTNTAEQEELKDIFNDFLNSFFNSLSEQKNNYYPKWDGNSLIIVDADGNKCNDQSVYLKLEEHLEEYNFKYAADKTIKLITN